MRFIPRGQFEGLNTPLTDLLFRGGGRFVFFAGPAGAPGAPGSPAGAGTGTSGTPAKAKPKEDEEEKEAAAEESEVNKALLKKLDSLTARGAISAATAEEGKHALLSRKPQQRTLAQQLANEEIDEATFGLTNDALQSDSSSQRALARLFISKKINRDTIENAINDLDSGDTYAAPLARRLANSRIDREEFGKAHDGLNDTDPDVKRASQMLATGHMTPQKFREELRMSERKMTDAQRRAEQAKEKADTVAATRKRVHDQIVDLLLQTDVIIEQLPERERTRPLLTLRNNLASFNNKDHTNQSALTAYLHKLTAEEGLSKEDAHTIREYDADKPEDFDDFRLALTGAIGLSSSTAENIIKLKKEEFQIEQDFIKQAKIANDLLKSAMNLVNTKVMEERMLEEAKRRTGIALKAGTQIQYIHPDPELGNLRTVKIKKIETTYAPMLDGHTSDANVIGGQPSGFVVHLDNGESHTIGRFIKWVDTADIHESIPTQADLEKTLGLPEIGMTLKSGQQLDFTTGYTRDDKGNVIPKRDKVQIVSVSDNGVVLNKPVTTLTPEEAPYAGLTEPRMTREMNLGEFAKWARRNEAVPPINSVGELRDLLKQHKTNLDNQYQRDAAKYAPIRVEPGETLQFGDDPNRGFKIKEVGDDGIKFESGHNMTLPQFFDWARKNFVERSNPEELADRTAKDLAKAGMPPEEVEAAKEGSLSKWVKSFFDREVKKAEDGEPDEKKGESFWQKMNPFEPSNYKPYGPIRELWNQYTFLSLMDVWNMVKAIWEFIKRKHERRSKNRYSALGKNLPFGMGTEFARINQSAETEEVNQYKEAMSNWGTWQILDKMHTTNSKDEMKACFIAMSEKGEIRWDDMKIWATLNRLSAKFTNKGDQLYIHLTHKPQINPKTGAKVSGEDRVKDVLDEFWGEGQWAEWFSKNINAYNNDKNAYEYKGKQLEADPKGTDGLAGELQRLLTDWKEGRYVKPQEYEELIDFAIKYGKMTAEAKMYYLIEGVTARSPFGPAEGMTLLHMDRIGELDGRYLNQFPLLDFLTDKNEKPFHPKYLSGEYKDIKETKRGFTAEDLEDFRDAYYKKESESCAPDKNFSRFMWESMLVNPQFRIRLSKGLRNAQNMDHDDAHFLIPPASLEEIKTLTRSVQGAQKYFTNEGYKNGYPGFNQYLVSLSNRRDELVESKENGMPIDDKYLEENTGQIVDALKAYFCFDSYMSARRDVRDDSRARLDETHFRAKPVNDPSFTVGEHKAQMDNLVKAICEAYGIDWRAMRLFEAVRYNDRQQQQEIENQMEEFLQNKLPEAIKMQGADNMLRIISERKQMAGTNSRDPNALRGIYYSNRLVPKSQY